MKKKDYKKILEKHMCNLSHFINEGGWALRIDRKKAEGFCKDCGPAFSYDYEKGLLSRDKSHDINQELLVEFWKFKYEEVSEDYSRLYNKIEKVLLDH